MKSRFIRGGRKIPDGRGVLGQGVKAGTGESVSQELGLRHSKLAFAQALGVAQLQDVMEMLNMRG